MVGYPERKLYKVLIGLLKIIPMLLAFITMAGTMFNFLGLDASVFSFLGGISIFPLLFLYLASYAFRFCIYHRMFLNYIVANNILVYTDYLIGIPVDDLSLLMIHVVVAGIFLFLVLYFYLKLRCYRQ